MPIRGLQKKERKAKRKDRSEAWRDQGWERMQERNLRGFKI